MASSSPMSPLSSPPAPGAGRRPIVRTTTVLAAAAALLAPAPQLRPAPAGAAAEGHDVRPAPAGGAAEGDGYVRLAHLSPDTPAVDVYLYAAGHDRPRLVLRHVGYGALSPYQRLAGGSYKIAMRPASAPATSEPKLSGAVRIRRGGAYTVAGMGPFKGLKLQILHDSGGVPAARSGLRIVAASLKQPRLDATADGVRVAGSLRFPRATPYRPLRPGTATVRVWGLDGFSATRRIKLTGGSLNTVIVLDGRAGLRLIHLRDTTRGRAAPRGGVGTGLGGLARGATPAAAGRPAPSNLAAGPPGSTARTARSASAQAGRVEPVGRGGGPVELRVPAIGVRGGLERLWLGPRGELAAPRDPGAAGWFAGGVRPGEPGPAVIAGHLDSRAGPAVFARLGSVRGGADVLITDGRGSVFRFVVHAVRRYPKDRFPTGEVYGGTPDPQLRLITCGGRFDPGRGHYLDNVVVFAALAKRPERPARPKFEE